VVFDTTTLSLEQATELLRAHLSDSLTVTGIRRLHGGMVNSVLELSTDGRPRSVVAKLCGRPGHTAFERELRALRWYRANTAFPVPEPYACDVSASIFPGSCLLMERLPGVNLAEAGLDGTARARIERQMARILADLHEQTRGTYGSALDPPEKSARRWLDRFGPRIRAEYDAVAERLTPRARRATERVLAELDRWLPESGRPTLVHGDLWATNIIVERRRPDGPAISGFVDGGCEYTDVEYELAYLRVFDTAGVEFFREYARRHPLRPGFETRCRIYWLNTMLLHVRVFGDAHYVAAAEALAQELERLGARTT